MYNILLIDDEPMLKLGVRNLLKNSTYIIAGTANNGMEALSLLKVISVDIIITDLKMPIMDGIELIHRLKADNFQGVIIVLSNYADFDLVRDALTAGASDYILKNEFTREILIEHLDKVSKELHARMQSVWEKDKLRANKLQLFHSEWLSYLNDTSSISQDSIDLLIPDKSIALQCSLLLVSIQYASIPQERKKHLMIQIKEVLYDILGNSEHIIILQTGTYNLFCIIPSNLCVHDINSLNRMIQRQISMYFNIMPSISYSQNNITAQQIRESYYNCRLALRYTFYYPEHSLFSTTKYPPFHEGDISLAQDLWKNIADACQDNNETLLTETLLNFILSCQQDRINPDWTIETILRFAQQLIFVSGCTIESTTTLEDLHKSTDRINLLENSTRIFLLISNKSNSQIKDIYTKKEIRDIVFFIMSHYTEHITLEHISTHVNLSKSYLCRLFKKQTGINLFAFLNQIRMEKGAQCIRIYKDSCNIKEIASMVGIEDPFYFTRKFKSYFGKSPTDYIKELK